MLHQTLATVWLLLSTIRMITAAHAHQHTYIMILLFQALVNVSSPWESGLLISSVFADSLSLLIKLITHAIVWVLWFLILLTLVVLALIHIDLVLVSVHAWPHLYKIRFKILARVQILILSIRLCYQVLANVSFPREFIQLINNVYADYLLL